MPQIGQFTRTADGYSGRIRSLSFDCALTFVTAENADSENAPAYRVHLGDEGRGQRHGGHSDSAVSLAVCRLHRKGRGP